MLTDVACVQPDFLERFFPSVLDGVEGDEHSESVLCSLHCLHACVSGLSPYSVSVLHAAQRKAMNESDGLCGSKSYAGADGNPYCKYDSQALQWFTSSLFIAGVFAALPAGHVTK